jgi:hypothetical protein
MGHPIRPLTNYRFVFYKTKNRVGHFYWPFIQDLYRS